MVKVSDIAKLSSVSELYECMKYLSMQHRPRFKYTNSKTLNKYLQHIYWLSNIYCLHILFIYYSKNCCFTIHKAVGIFL